MRRRAHEAIECRCLQGRNGRRWRFDLFPPCRGTTTTAALMRADKTLSDAASGVTMVLRGRSAAVVLLLGTLCLGAAAPSSVCTKSAAQLDPFLPSVSELALRCKGQAPGVCSSLSWQCICLLGNRLQDVRMHHYLAKLRQSHFINTFYLFPTQSPGGDSTVLAEPQRRGGLRHRGVARPGGAKRVSQRTAAPHLLRLQPCQSSWLH